jgi:phosphoribosyl 1,2-cyclic phosphodiesterase
LRFATLGSGSRGNATLVDANGVRLLVDLGFSLRETQRRLALLGVEPDGVQALLLTHEHGDHGRGVAAFATRYGVPVWTTPGTWRAMGSPRVPALRLFSGHGGSIALNGMRVLPYPVPHDAREPCQFALECGGRRLGMLTDAGAVTPHMRALLKDCDSLILECNHDRELLSEGPYPPALQRRVAGVLGHLSNAQAADLLDGLPHAALRTLLIAHISQKNNRPDLVLAMIAGVSESLASRARLAAQDTPGPWLDV